MYRKNIRLCPSCREPFAPVMLEFEGEPTEIDVCGLCGGVYFDFEDGTPGLLAKRLLDALPAASSEVGEGSSPCTCPDCESDMVEHEQLEQVFRCARCWSVFCARSSLESLAMTSAALKRPGEENVFQWLLRLLG